MRDYIQSLIAQDSLDENSAGILDQIDVRSSDDLDSLVRAFPSIGDVGIQVSRLSSIAAMQVTPAYRSMTSATGGAPPPFGFGARPPPFVSTPPGTIVGVAPPRAAAPPPTGPNLDIRLTNWPVKDQGSRGTCVAFGASACAEHLIGMNRAPNALSEQFLYWSIKNQSNDPSPADDGTWLEYARDMLVAHGICKDAFCSYIPTPQKPVGGVQPGSAAVADALLRKHSAPTHVRKPSGAAAQILNLLGNGRPVAVSVPIFRDPALPGGPTNWETGVGVAYGRILNPPPKSVVDGGHCVCVTGFVPDAGEPNGGYFVIRNSWGTRWAHSVPTSSYRSPERGYGEISATYIETYCWEFLQL